MQIEVDRLDGRRTMAIADRITALYRSCYRRPPWSETPEQMASYDDKLARAAARPGFTALAAVAPTPPPGTADDGCWASVTAGPRPLSPTTTVSITP